MAAQTFLLPDLGEGLTEAVIVRWLVSVGDTVAIDQAIAEVETAKSIVELPSPFGGTVLALHGAEGEAVLTGSPVLEVGEAGDQPAANAGSAAPATDTADDHENTELDAYRAEERAGSGSGNVLIGYGTGSVAAKGRRRRKTVTAQTANAAEKAAAVPAAQPASAPSAAVAVAAEAAVPGAAFGPVAVRSPIVRRLARELGVDPRSIAATGSDGAVTRADVLRAAEALGASVATTQAGSTQPAGDEVAGLHGLRLASAEKLSPLRKVVSAKLSRSRSEIPEATVWVDVDFTELWQLRPQMAAAGERPPSVTTLIARFVLMALEEYPLLASRLSEDGTELMTFDGVNLGIAVDSERGLSVPVLPRATDLSIIELDSALKELSAEARTGRLAPAKLSGSTFTFNNYGGFGVDGSAAIINHPEVAILGMGRVIERPWVVNGEIVVRRIAQLSLAFDHRVCDGGYAAGFIGSLVEKIEHPLRSFPRL
ncbi:dihydrolipoamide acetyltransferase family protein [Leucobacter sp. UT-8R-CII-1-4]|uniref:dihydrolipoamide acetyltransferase family protein n=1 Tax=Leucobacter sp. UT-8R-CII-1-4 TaxID=3040075 RepID=UPI0024A9488D|nr:dihydrolipoamide acetyltransferase family protein [Leucobacter sp. UT-8R-CII-1-4]MDI6022241.1 dihydrolipoamide acetyltransferase family protein [Leucobacter sp. UT-8R-CII-1-4]